MPYKVGAKGSYGCSGYPAVKDDGTVMGCHKTRSEAAGQIYAINRSEGNIGKAMPSLKEGDWALTSHGEEDEFHIGQVVHVMYEGRLGVEGGEYTLEASAENPAVMIQLYEQDESGFWEATREYSACMMSLMIPIDPLPTEPELSDMEMAMDNSMMYQKSIDPFNALGKIEKRDYSSGARERMAESGNAMPDGSFPIANATDLRNAIQSVGRAKDYARAKAHITRRAKELGLTNMLPSEWGAGVQKSILADAFDPTFFLK
jgi:hypothetical protein